MSKRYIKKIGVRPKAPFIRSFGCIIAGVLFFIMLFYLLSLGSYNNISDFIGAIGAVVLLGGLGTLGIIVGIKKRRW